MQTIVETERDEVFEQQEERSGETFDQQEERSEQSFDQQTEVPEALTGNTTEPNPNSTPNMETDAYNRKLIQIKLEVDRVDRKRGAYTKDQVNEIDHTRCHVKLDEIQNAEESCQDKIFELIYELDENVAADEARIKSLRSLSDDLRKRVMTNANEVKVRMAEILREKEENKPMSAWEKKNLELKQQEDAKRATLKSNNLLKKIDKCVEKAENLINKLKGEKDVETMTEQEIRKSILNDVKEWKAELSEVQKARDAIDDIEIELSVSDQESLQSMKEKCQEATDLFEERRKSLTAKDEALGLYTLAPSKNKDNVCYPKVFTGRLGENVHKFIAEFKLALEADHVRTKDEVKTLIKYLDADAKTSVGEHVQCLEDAFKVLKITYGNPALIWNNVKQNISKSLGKSAYWSKPESVERRNSITKLIDFISEMRVLAKEHEVLKTEIYSIGTITHIFSVLPKNIKDDISDKTDCDQPIDNQIDAIEEVLKKHRSRTLYRLTYDTQTDDSKPSFNKKPSVNTSVKSSGKHNCVQSFQCNEDWGILGCIKLYEIKKRDERKNLIRTNKLCMKCGDNFVPRKDQRWWHRCSWKDGKFKAKCTEKDCKYAAALCGLHSDNASPELLDWLHRNKVKFVADVVFAKIPQVNEFIHKGKGRKSFDTKSKSPSDIDTNTRRLLQSGKFLR